MKSLEIIRDKYQHLILLIIPIIYFVLSYYFNAIQGLFSTRSVDPEYVYMISGLNIASLKFNLGHIDHPGSPLQYFLALCFRITYILKSKELPFVEDVLMNAESYLKIANLVLNIVLTGFLSFIGYKCFQLTRNIAYAILLQTTPFITQITYDTLGRIVPEPLMLIPILLLCIILLGIIYGKYQPDSLKTILWLGILSGFALSIKLTCFSLWLIPFILINKWKNKFIFIGTGLLSFLTISIPVTLHLEAFWIWSKKLFMHSEKYGKGDSNVVDLQTLYPQMMKIIGANKSFFYFLLALILVSIIYYIFKRNRSKDILLKISGALILTVIIQLFFVGKHFGYHYFIPALFLFPSITITALILLSKIIRTRHLEKLTSAGIILFIIIATFNQYPLVKSKADYLIKDNAKKMPIKQEVEKLEKRSIKLIVPASNGSAAHEYAMFFAYAYSGNEQKPRYQSLLSELYPYSYIFLPWDSTLHYWSKLDVKKTANEKIPIYLIIQNTDEQKIENSIKKFKEIADIQGIASTEQIYQAHDFNAGIYRIRFKAIETVNE